MKSLNRTEITCKICDKKQFFCTTGRPLSGLCTDCRKKEFKRLNPEPKKPDLYCQFCFVKVGKNSKTLQCKTCYVKNRKEHIVDYSNKYSKKRYREDVLFNTSKKLRSRLSHALREFKLEKRNISAIKDLGCSMNYLITYLESKFDSGMSWENYGQWHIDHVKPLSSAITIEEMRALMHYSNLQPLWAKDNLKKSNCMQGGV